MEAAQDIPLIQPTAEDEEWPIFEPDALDLVTPVLGFEMDPGAPVIEWPGGLKTVLPFIPHSEKPRQNQLFLVSLDMSTFK